MAEEKRYTGPFSTVTYDGRAIVDVNRLVKSEKVRRAMAVLDKEMARIGLLPPAPASPPKG